jgi:Kef-type K+ transport system membrane component KefB
MVRMPIPPTEIVLGSLFAYAGFIYDDPYFDLVAQTGFLYLMFLAGMEVDLKQLLNSPKDIIHKSLLFLLLLSMISAIFGAIFDLNNIIIISMPLISVGLLATLSKTYDKNDNWLSLAFTAGILGEVLSITALTIFDAASKTGYNLHLLIEVGYLGGFVLVVFILYKFLQILFWWFPELKLILMPKTDIANQDIRLAMSLFFMFIAIMISLNLELALGSFIAGVAISAFFHHQKELEEKMSSLGFGFLIPIFFIHVGSSFDLKSLMAEGVVSGALLITILMIGSRVIAAYVLRAIYKPIDALLVAFSLSMPLTLLIAVATIGDEAQLITHLEYYQLVLASIIEVVISMGAIKMLYRYTKNNNL